MTAPTAKQRRLTAIERELRRIATILPEVLALKATNAQQAATIARLIGENERLRECVKRQAGRLAQPLSGGHRA